MTVYGDLTYAVEVGMVLIVVGLGLSAIFTTRISQELRNELLLIGAGLLIPLAILHTLFTGLNDWEMGHTDPVGAVVPPLVVAWLSFLFWSTLTPSALMLIGIRLGLVQERIDPTGARRMWDYFLVWNKLLRIYGELNKWGAILFFLFLFIYYPLTAPPDNPEAYLLLCFPLFFVILYFSQDRSKAPKSTNFSTPTGLVEFAEVANRMQETGFMELVEEGGGNVMGVEGIIERLQEAPPQVQDDQWQRYVYAKEFYWAYIFALMWPGLDRFYLGDSRKGILFSVSALVLLPIIVPSLVLWLVNLFSVYRRTHAYNLNAMKKGSQANPSEGTL
jgi:TM2 domain-containing membrane protein YozV